MALTGDFIDATRAAEIGLVNRVVPAGSALDAAKELAATICANGPLAVKVSKQVITESGDWGADEMWEKQQAIVMPIFGSEDVHRATENSAACVHQSGRHRRRHGLCRKARPQLERQVGAGE